MDLELDNIVDKSAEPLYPIGANQLPTRAIIVWEFYEAPEYVRAHSTHGGDEDGIVWVPIGTRIPWWIEKLWMHYGPGIDAIRFKDGLLIIWSH